MHLTEFKKPAHTAGAVIFALILLFNPNINLIDVLPDFIAYFILAKVFLPASDMAPHFEEARRNFIRLGYINLAKIPGLLIITTVRSGNTLDNDIVALLAFCFAVIELIFLIPAIQNIFDALSYLGERTDASELIRGDSLSSTDALRSFTTVFAVLKCLLYFLPETLRLTRSVEIGTTTSMLTGSKYYSLAVVAAVILGLIFGSVWLFRMIRYVKRIKKEGRFYDSLLEIASDNAIMNYGKKQKKRYLDRTYLCFILASVFSLDLIFDNYNQINLLPGFIFGILFLIGTLRISSLNKSSSIQRTVAFVCGIGYITVSLVNYVFSVRFLTEFGYSSLLKKNSAEAISLYKTIEALSLAEAALNTAIWITFFIIMRKYIYENVGLPIGSPTYRNTDALYHRELCIRTLVLSIFGTTIGILDLVNVFAKGNSSLLFTHEDDVTMPTIITSSMPWMGVVITAVTVVYILYSIYYFNYLKENE